MEHLYPSFFKARILCGIHRTNGCKSNKQNLVSLSLLAVGEYNMMGKSHKSAMN